MKINAIQARAIADKALNDRIAKREAAAKDFCDTFVEEAIVEAASKCCGMLMVKFADHPNICDWSIIARFLEEEGYNTNLEKNVGRLVITW